MNPNTHNNYFPPTQPDDDDKQQHPTQQPYGPGGDGNIPVPNPQYQSGNQPFYPPTNNNQLPEAQYGAPTPGQQQAHQPYDFIMNPETGPRKQASLKMPGGSSTALRVAIIGVGLIVLIVVVGTFLSFLNKPKFDYTQIISIAQEQQELVRVAGLGAANGDSQSTLNSANTIKVSIQSDGIQLLSYLAKNHVKVNQKTIALKKNPQTDSRLNTAAAASTFDSTYTTIIQGQLQAYQRDLKAAYAANPGPNGQKILSTDYNNASLLLTQTQQQ